MNCRFHGLGCNVGLACNDGEYRCVLCRTAWPCEHITEFPESCPWRLRAEREAARAEIGMQTAIAAAASSKAIDTCDACAGSGAPISGLPCMCGGSGRMSDAAIWLRSQLIDATAKQGAAVAALKEVCTRLREEGAKCVKDDRAVDWWTFNEILNSGDDALAKLKA